MTTSPRHELDDVRRDREPEVGIGGTVTVGTDAYPCTIVEVPRRDRVVVVLDDFRVVSGSERTNDARYSIDPSNVAEALASDRKKLTFTKRRDGRWRARGSRYGDLLIGWRRVHMNPHF